MSEKPNFTKTAGEMVAEAKTRVRNLDVAHVADAVKKGALLVDLRESEERQREGVIPGALHAPRGMIEFYADPATPYHRAEFAPEQRIILHCASGSRSALAADTLQQMGYQDVAHLDGGFKAWKEQGQPIQASS